jgi:hypothetical protein
MRACWRGRAVVETKERLKKNLLMRAPGPGHVCVFGDSSHGDNKSVTCARLQGVTMWSFVDCRGVKRVASGAVKWCLLSFGAFCDLLADFLADSCDRVKNSM